jgi:hypothetical protein
MEEDLHRPRANCPRTGVVEPGDLQLRALVCRLRALLDLTADEDPVFVRPAGGYLDADVLRRRSTRATSF